MWSSVIHVFQTVHGSDMVLLVDSRSFLSTKKYEKRKRELGKDTGWIGYNEPTTKKFDGQEIVIRASIYPPVVVLVCASQRELPTMFLLSVVEDNIKVSPEQFGRDLTEVIIEQLEIKYLNKVSIYLPICIHYTFN